MRKIFILCDGGLGNRLCSLLGGMITADLLNISEFEILWPETIYCNCKFEKLFANKFLINNSEIDIFLKKNLDNIYLTHLNIDNLKEYKYPFSHSIDSINTIRNMNQDVIYGHCSFSSFMKTEDIIKKLKTIKINKEIRIKVNDFCEKNKIDDKVIGIHLRRTDFKYNINDNQKFIDIIKSKPRCNFFVCSDDKETEELFKNLKNVILRPKNKYVEKLKSDKNWVDDFNNQGVQIKYNVNRIEEAVIEGFIDMLVLSRTNLKEYKSVGSFYLLSCLFKKI